MFQVCHKHLLRQAVHISSSSSPSFLPFPFFLIPFLQSAANYSMSAANAYPYFVDPQCESKGCGCHSDICTAVTSSEVTAHLVLPMVCVEMAAVRSWLVIGGGAACLYHLCRSLSSDLYFPDAMRNFVRKTQSGTRTIDVFCFIFRCANRYMIGGNIV